MKMKFMHGILAGLLWVSVPVFAQEKTSPSDIIVKMQANLNLTQEQVYNITPIIQRYALAFDDLQKSVEDGTINPSAVDSQKQELQAEEDQDLSVYLTANEISQWHYIRNQAYQQTTKDSDDSNADSDVYSNLPRDISTQN